MAARQPTDLVVVLPGITGSTLHRDGRPVWEPSGGALLHALLTLGGSLRRLTLPDGIGDDHPGDGVVPVALVDSVHVIPGLWTPIKGYDVLLARLEALGMRRPSADAPGNLLPMPYDWRLSNRYTATWMAPTIQRELERWRAQGGRYADAKVTFVCHSMGGLVARRYAAANRDQVRKIVTFGTPMRGSMNAVDQLVNGAPGKLGPLRGLVTDLSRSLPSLHQLLPSYACVVGSDGLGEPTHLAADGIPGADAAMVGDGLAFHAELEAAEAGDPGFAASLHPLVGTNQPTQSTVHFPAGGGATIYATYGEDDFQGDATVPLVGAVPKGVALDDHILHHVPENHGALQCHSGALDQLEAVLLAKPIVIKGGLQVPLSVTVPELVAAGEALEVRVAVAPGNRPGLRATLTPVGRRGATGGRGRPTTRELILLGDGSATVSFADLRPGAYVVDVTGAAPGSPVAPVSAATLVWDPNAALD